MAIRCIAIDDEPLALRQISSYISKIPFLQLESTFCSAMLAQEWLKENSIDLIFVDINMPDMTGVEFVQTLDTPTMVIFTTAYAEYAIEGFKLSAIDYLLKPFGLKDITRAAEKAQSLYELLQLHEQKNSEQAPQEETIESSDEAGVLSVHADRKTHLVKMSNIVYVESAGEYVRLHLADGSKLVTLSVSRIWRHRYNRRSLCVCIDPTSSTSATLRVTPRDECSSPTRIMCQSVRTTRNNLSNI